MIGVFSRRFYHVGKTYFAAGSNSSSLAKLRKTTGYSVSNCKKALEKFPDNFQKAEEWLREEAKKMGWSKWNKIQSRKAVQGIIGVHTNNNLGVMLEVNCETDFVAKNAEFQELLGHIIKGCIINEQTFLEKPPNTVQKVCLEEGDLMNLKCSPSSVQELVNAAMCKFNEKVVLKRAVLMKVAPHSPYCIAGLSHPSESRLGTPFPPTALGKFGALLAYEYTGDVDSEKQELGVNMCQHIIGMNPSCIGEEDFHHLYETGKIKIADSPQNDLIIETVNVGQKDELEEEKITDPEENFKTDVKESDEARLLLQPYLLDPNMHVYDYTWKRAMILDFERFECGGESRNPAVIENVAQARM